MGLMRAITQITKVLAVWLCLGGVAKAEQATIAVASNFITTAQALIGEFESRSAHHLTLVHGSTGHLFAQISHGAPFDVFLAADAARPEMLEQDGFAVVRKPYAIGQLVYATLDAVPADLAQAKDAYARIAIANPETAPYGAAAKQVLIGLRGRDHWDANVVFGENVGQAFGFLISGNVAGAFVSRAQISALPDGAGYVDVPSDLFDDIRQDAVLTRRGQSNPAAVAFFEFLSGETARAMIQNAGYVVPE